MGTGLRVSAEGFSTPKAGNTETEYEDALWLPRRRGTYKRRYRYAVADGATEASYSKIWAECLIRAFGKDLLREGLNFDADLRGAQRLWREKVDAKRPLPWYAEEHIRRGAFAALLGLCLEFPQGNGGAGEWRALAVGDSCLVQVRGDEILARFPLDRSDAFTNRPHLLSSNPSYNKQATDHLRLAAGTLMPGDTFFLMTDAVACWFMWAVEAEQTPWRDLREIDDQVMPFAEWIGNLREGGAMQNDDATLVRVVVE